ncbi:MAG TPA: response regulator transcription factor [Terriglobales bacterium]|nr:response regulator transcription factor [Terriglobales bacterium]
MIIDKQNIDASLHGEEHSPLKPPTILLADDHSMVLERVRSLLRNFHVVGTANNGRDLVHEALRLQPDIIISDITMPILTGIEAAHELREAGSTSKFVFLTVHKQPAFLHACFAEGALGYVAKSHLGTDLVPAISKVLSGHRFISPSIPL